MNYNIYTFFFKWFLQRDGAKIKPENLQPLAILAGILGLVFDSKVLLIAGIAFYIFNYVLMNWNEYRKRTAYEGYLKGQRPTTPSVNQQSPSVESKETKQPINKTETKEPPKEPYFPLKKHL